MHEHHHSTTSRLKLAFFLNFGFSIFEFFGGLFTNSVALMSDSIHDMGDAFAIALSWFFNKKATQEPNEKYTYGYSRYSLLGGLVTAVVLLIGLIFLLLEAVPRLLNPEPIKVTWLLGFAVVGLIVNGIAAYNTSKGSTINERVVAIHLLEDVLGWAVLLVSSIVMLFVNVPILDPLLSIGYAIFILYQVYKNIKEIVGIMMEKAPHNLNLELMKQNILSDSEVLGIHHIHVWSLDGNRNILTLHVVLKPLLEMEKIIQAQKRIHQMVTQAGVSHATIEFEFDHECSDENCQLFEGIEEEHHHNHHH